MRLTSRLLPLASGCSSPAQSAFCPPSILAHLYRYPPRRPFSSTPRRLILTTTLDTTHAALAALHTTTHLPWCLTLPLTALLIRLTLILPITLYTRKSQRRQLSLQPLLSAWQHQIRRSTLATSHALGPAQCTSIANAALRKKRKALYSRFACPWWKNYLPIAQLPVFLVVIETIRRMCGTHSGLLGLITTNPFSAPAIDPDTPRDATLSTLSVSETPSAESYVEPSLATEGALWFPNLLVPDPHLLLPFILSGTLFLNIHLSARQASPSAVRTPFQRRLTNALKIVALAIGPATLNVPAGMLVYWTSSAIFALGMGRAVDMWMPLRPPLKSRSTDEGPGVEDIKKMLRQGDGRPQTRRKGQTFPKRS